MSAAPDIFTAVTSGNAADVQAALDADPAAAAARDGQGRTALMLALYYRKPELLPLLLEARAELDLFEAAALGRADQLQRLLARDASAAQSFAPDGFTALHLAAFFGRADAARLLLDRGADPSSVAKNDMRVQPLHSAAAGGHEAVCRLLLEHGADADARQQAGFVPLHAAANLGDLALVNLLLHFGADADARTDDGRSAIDLADARGHAPIAARLRAEL